MQEYVITSSRRAGKLYNLIHADLARGKDKAVILVNDNTKKEQVERYIKSLNLSKPLKVLTYQELKVSSEK